MTDDATHPLRFRQGQGAEALISEKPAWNILIVDDDEGVHSVTKLVLRNKEVLGAGLALLSAYSADECREILKERADIAVMLLDVVMETDDAGLELVRWIREELGNKSVRIILRTGQPGKAPETSIISQYEINDYKEKTELTYEKLWSCVVTAVRGYRDITVIEQSRAGMEMILNAAPALFRFQSLKLLASGVLKQLISILKIGKNATLVSYSGFSAIVADNSVAMLAGSGRFEGLEDSALPSALGEGGMAHLRAAMERRDFVFEGGNLALSVVAEERERHVVFIEGCDRLGDLERPLLSLFMTNVAAAFENLKLYSEVETRLAEKTQLVHEIHHRVKNNLQIILSLIELGDPSDPEAMMDGLRRRIGALAIIHDRLSFVEDGKSIDFAETAADLVTEATSRVRAKYFPEVHTSADAFAISLDVAIPCALILEEILSAAFEDYRPGTPIELSLASGEGGQRSIVVSYETASTRAALCESSHMLVSGLASQINGKFAADAENGRMAMRLDFAPRAKK